jgi:hypothetical protein
LLKGIEKGEWKGKGRLKDTERKRKTNDER